MQHHLPLIALCAGLASALAVAAEACPWAGGIYSFNEHGIYGDFSVNADCTEIVWDRLSDGPETSALTRSRDGWAGELAKVEVELLANGHNLRVTGYGGPMRQVQAKRSN